MKIFLSNLPRYELQLRGGAFCMLRENIIMYIMWLKNATEQINELLSRSEHTWTCVSGSGRLTSYY